MKKLLTALILTASVLGFSQEVPKVSKTQFSTAALSQKLSNTDGKKVTVKEILNKHKGQIVVIDFWASWCKDCIAALPGMKTLKDNNPNVHFVYFSLDRKQDAWKNGLEKFNLTQNENYWFDEGWQNAFNNYVELNWIPRFMVINQKGGIAKYYAITPEDPEIQNTINQLQKTN